MCVCVESGIGEKRLDPKTNAPFHCTACGRVTAVSSSYPNVFTMHFVAVVIYRSRFRKSPMVGARRNGLAVRESIFQRKHHKLPNAGNSIAETVTVDLKNRSSTVVND